MALFACSIVTGVDSWTISSYSEWLALCSRLWSSSTDLTMSILSILSLPIVSRASISIKFLATSSILASSIPRELEKKSSSWIYCKISTRSSIAWFEPITNLSKSWLQFTWEMTQRQLAFTKHLWTVFSSKLSNVDLIQPSTLRKYVWSLIRNWQWGAGWVAC